MNLENYKVYQMVACTNTETGKFAFVCQATPDGIKECRAKVDEANTTYQRKIYDLTFFSAWMKNEQSK